MAAQARDRPAERPDPRAHRRRRPGLRPRHRRAASSSATWSTTDGALHRRRAGPGAAPHLRRARPARRRVPAPRLWNDLDAPALAALAAAWSTSRAARARSRGSGGCRAAPFRAALEATEAIWAELERPRGRAPASRQRAAVGRASRSRRTAGRRARRSTACCAMPTWPPATSCAGRSRPSTCSTRSRSWPTASSAAPRASSIDGIRRGIVAYSSVGGLIATPTSAARRCRSASPLVASAAVAGLVLDTAFPDPGSGRSRSRRSRSR